MILAEGYKRGLATICCLHSSIRQTAFSGTCYDNEYAPVLSQMPFMFGEFGESVDGSDCTVTAVNTLMSWADQHGAGYSAWDWDTWGGCLQLITDYTTGNPDGNWGTAYKNHLASLP